MNSILIKKRRDSVLKEWPHEGLEFLERCPICQHDSARLLYSDLEDRVFSCAPGKWKMYQCYECGVAYLNPRPDKKTIGEAYKTYYTHSPSKRLKAEKLKGYLLIRRCLANGYRRWRYGSQEKPCCHLGVLLYLIPPLRELIDIDLRFLPKYRPGFKVLDVGCGDGSFLKSAKEIGWNTYGADPDPQAALICQAEGIEIRLGGIESFDEKKDYFEAITLSHVLEHVHDPIHLLAEAFKLLKPGGQLYIDTPNIQSWGHKIYGRHWFHLDPPRHLIIFNWSTLVNILIKLGYTNIQRKFRTFVFAPSLAASQALQQKRSPFPFYQRPPILAWVRGYALSFLASLYYQNSEFITILANKPI